MRASSNLTVMVSPSFSVPELRTLLKVKRGGFDIGMSGGSSFNRASVAPII